MRVILFQLGKLDFGETAAVSFSVALDPEETIKKCGKTYAVTPVALSYKSKEPNSMPYYEQLVPMSVAFKVPGKIPTAIEKNTDGKKTVYDR